jgi:peptide/nickel transport system permease protein
VLRYIAGRLVWVVVLLFGISVLTFVLFFLLPGDPAASSVPRQATPEIIEQVRQRMGLDQPIWRQYLDLLHGPDRIGVGQPSGILNWPPNLGYSFKHEEPVLDIILDRLPVTLSLAFGSAVLWLLIGIPLGILAGLRPHSIQDRAATVFALLGASTPVFLAGLLLLYFLSFKLRIFPAPRYTPLTEHPIKWAQGLFLVWLSVALGLSAFYTRLTRASMLEVEGEDYIRTARSKGLTERRVVGRHVLRPTLTPLVTLLGLDLGALVGGAIVTETMFGLPGIAQATVRALVDLDLPLLVGVVLTNAFFVVMFNLLVDLLYVALDPRVRYAQWGVRAGAG